VLVPASTAPTLADDELLPGFGEVAEEIASFSIIDDRSWGDVDNEVFAATSGHLRATAIYAIIRRKGLLWFKVRKRIEDRFNLKNDVAAFAAITAIGAAARFVFFTAKMDHAVAAFSGSYMNIYLVNEHSYIIMGENDLSGRWQKSGKFDLLLNGYALVHLPMEDASKGISTQLIYPSF
jgi:hypothetical protein